jgi:hypothetical protein
MQVTSALLLALLWLSTPTRPQAPPKASLLKTIKAARRECPRPGAKLAALVERSFDARVFGKEVVPDWDKLSEDQRAAFAPLADAVIGSQQRQDRAQWFCQASQHVTSMEKLGADAITRVWTRYVLTGETQRTELWFRDDGDRWTFVGSWCCGVDVFILTWRDRFKDGYEAAMTRLRADSR